MSRLFELCNQWMYDNCGCVNWDMQSYCWADGFWSWIDTVDDSGNIVDSERVITPRDLQAACDNVGIEVDCINF